jgi:dTDP-4-amino-4,6-dideoxygalactose transaminase
VIPFNKFPLTGEEQQYVLQAMQGIKMSGDGFFGKKCQAWFENHLGSKKTLFTPSCTAALEMAAILINIEPGDEVIMPSYTFVSTANAFVLRGAKIKFVDIRTDTMNIDESKIETAITSKTKAIVPVHYAGVACEMDAIMSLANSYGLFVIEDAAQGVMSSYKGRALGSIGHLSAFSFHETKNYTSGGEGGLLIINDESFIQRAEIIREKGTNRSQFFRGEVDKYTWDDLGSSYLPCELQAAYLWGQLQKAVDINKYRLELWNNYFSEFQPLADRGLLELATIPLNNLHNAHMFYVKLKNIRQRTDFIEVLKNKGISTAFHYIPLHSSPAGRKFGEFCGQDNYTTNESERLIRLPIYYGMTAKEQKIVIEAVLDFFVES